MNAHRRRWPWILLVVLFALGIGLALSWRMLATELLTRELGKRGVVIEAFTLGGVSLHGIEFRDVTIRKPVALTLPNLALGISPSALLHGQWSEAVSSVTVESVALELVQSADGWRLNGEPLPQNAAAPEPSDKTAPPTTIGALPIFPDMEIKKGQLHVVTPGMDLSAPFSLISHRTDKSQQIQLTLEPLHMQQGATGIQISTVHLQVDAPLDGKSPPAGALSLRSLSVQQGERKVEVPVATIGLRWRQWAPLPVQAALDAPLVSLTGVPPELSTFAMVADCGVEQSRYDCTKIAVQSPTGNIRLQGRAAALYSTAKSTRWLVAGQAKHMLGGTLSFTAAPVTTGFVPAKLNLKAAKLQLQQVLSLLAEGKVTADGTVSGEIPLIWHGGEDVSFGQGSLHSDGPGVLHLSPELLHMDNKQIAMVTGILADFRYESVGIELEGGEKNTLKARLSLLGHNPAEWSGRQVKLNVNLGGDLLSLLKQSILPMSDPRQWLSNSPPSSP